MNRYKSALSLLITVVVMVSFSAGQSLAGTFKDRDGGSHSWVVGPSHELIWDGKPYLPFGVEFQPESFSSDAADAAFKADEAKLDALQKAGITDIILRPGNEGVASVSPAAVQKIIDLLENKGLMYGVDLRDAPYAPLQGYVVNPAMNRKDGISSSGVVTNDFAGTKSVITVLCDSSTGDIQHVEEFPTYEDSVSVPITVRSGSAHTLLFYPSKTIDSANASSGMPDLWADYGRHRDRLISGLSKVKFGKGLRFFIDPFASSFGIRGETEMLIPTSKSFQLQYSAWLSRKYDSLRGLGLSWGLTQRDAASYDEAVRYVPLWYNGRGVGAVYDPESGKKYAVDTTTSRIWGDLTEFRMQSAKAWTDGISDVVKREACDVPVVFSSSGMQSVFSTESQPGYDGFAILPAASSQSSIESTGEVLSMIDRSVRPTWMISFVRPSGDVFASREELLSAINSSRSLGSKGFIIRGSYEDQSGSVLQWLSAYASVSRDDRAFASYLPSIIYYPKGASHTGVQRLGGGEWWIPTDGPGNGLDLGPSLAGYAIQSPKNGVEEVYVWSLCGKQTIHLISKAPIWVSSDSANGMEMKPKKDVIELQVDETPVVVRGMSGSIFVPIEVVNELIDSLGKAVTAASSKGTDVTACQLGVDRARDLLKKGQPAEAAAAARAAIMEMKNFIDATPRGSSQRSVSDDDSASFGGTK